MNGSFLSMFARLEFAPLPGNDDRWRGDVVICAIDAHLIRRIHCDLPIKIAAVDSRPHARKMSESTQALRW
jgi:hypothetical protein